MNLGARRGVKYLKAEDLDAPFGPNVGLVDVWNLYMLFDDPNDSLNAIFVLQGKGQEMTHSSDLNAPFDGLGSGFYNWSLGTNTALPAGGVYNLNPDAADADTYLTIGLKAGTFDVNGAFFTPGAEQVLVDSGILSGNGSITEDFAYAASPDEEQTFPIDGRVLVLNIALLAGEGASGVWNIQWGNVGAGGGQAIDVQWTIPPIPAPGALALLGLAGFAGARSRRLRS